MPYALAHSASNLRCVSVISDLSFSGEEKVKYSGCLPLSMATGLTSAVSSIELCGIDLLMAKQPTGSGFPFHGADV